LGLLTEAQLVSRFQPAPRSLTHLNAGYYVAELLNALTEEDDPHPELYAAAAAALLLLRSPESPVLAVTGFELAILREIGQLPNFDTCTICHAAIGMDEAVRFWAAQSGLICSRCGHSEYEAAEFPSGSLAILRRLSEADDPLAARLQLTERQIRDVRRVATAAVSHVLGRRPKTLSLLKF
jgi:DNA repair protein RecO (recombination protein O)